MQKYEKLALQADIFILPVQDDKNDFKKPENFLHILSSI